MAKWGFNGQNLKKISRLNCETFVILFLKHHCSVIITFKVLITDLKFEYTRLAKKG